MSAKHTPGPWTVTPYVRTGAGYDLSVVNPAGDAEMGNWLIAGVRWRENAALISAAPDLLSIAQRWAALDGGAWNVERHALEKAELLDLTRAAIAKATTP